MVATHATALLGPTLALPRPAAADRAALSEPWILRVARPDFIAHLLAELADPAGHLRLAAARARPAAGASMLLEQPVHRSFNLVLVEARCVLPGMPRLDPARILSAGLVVRRIGRRGGEEGWFRRGRTPLGWQPAPAGSLLPDSDWEPDAALRAEHRRARHGAAIRVLLDRLPGPEDATTSEEATPLFPVPAALAERLGRTLLHGFLPVTSADRVEPGPAPEPLFSRADVRARVPTLLRPDRDDDLLPPVATSATRDSVRPDRLPETGGLHTLVEALTWLAQETGLFEGGPATRDLAAALDDWRLEFADGPERPSSAALAALYRNLLGEPEAGVVAVRLPEEWPAVGAALFERIAAGAEKAMRARFGSAAAGEGRFDDARALHIARCFLRLAPDREGCPPRLVWSAPTGLFRIKAWHEGSDQPPVQIELPRPDRLRGLRPDIAFKVPPELQRFMDKLNLQGLLDGSARPREGIAFGMICSFSIPIITLCAFIVLQIFLVLLNLVFFWLPFVRICLPFPKPPGEEG
jgi:hypothetical protein